MRRKISIIISILLLAIAIVAWSSFHRAGAFPCWVVWGHIVNENNGPIENAVVNVRFGVGAESKPFITGHNGRFFLYVIAPVWSVAKGGSPSISVYRTGYREYWGYYRQWPWGLRISRIEVKLQKGPENQPVREDFRAASHGLQ